jgi:RNA recognition motif-containing protein
VANLHVSNLSRALTEDDLRQTFSQYGTVVNVAIVKYRQTGRSRGFAFVEMADDGQAAAAIKELNLREIDGRAIHVDTARSKGQRPRSGDSLSRW